MSNRFVRLTLPAIVLALCLGCQSSSAPENAPSVDAQTAAESEIPGLSGLAVYVVSNGWHTGIVLARSDVSESVIPEIRDFPKAEYFEFSWGDAEYFPAPKKRVGMIMSALFTPTPAVLHMAGLPEHPRKVFPSAELISLSVTPEGFENLIDYLNETFDRDAPASTTPGLYRFSRFYPARGRFHMFNTCNTWTARGLKAAGFPVTITGTLQAEELMAQLR